MKNIAALSIPPQLVAAAFAGLLISAVCVLAVIGVIVILNVILPEKRKLRNTSSEDQEETK
ncbi:MAG: hypothetical protein IJY74_01750 [Oscillospiraceae bacterium]|nr:hypothetical protein [Oscillospiraceae bacterium]